MIVLFDVKQLRNILYSSAFLHQKEQSSLRNCRQCCGLLISWWHIINSWLICRHTVEILFLGDGFSHTWNFLIFWSSDWTGWWFPHRLSCESKLHVLSAHSTYRYEGKGQYKVLFWMILLSFNSIMGSIGLIGQTTSPSGTYFNSYLQKKKKRITMKLQNLLKQTPVITKLKRIRSTCCYRAHTCSEELALYAI